MLSNVLKCDTYSKPWNSGTTSRQKKHNHAIVYPLQISIGLPGKGTLKKKRPVQKKTLKATKHLISPVHGKMIAAFCSETEFPSKTLWKLNRIDSHQIDCVSSFVLSRECLLLFHGNAGLFTLGPLHTYLPFSWPNNKGSTGSSVFPLTLFAKLCLCFRMYIQTIKKMSI